jgi:hypothetical protein
MYCHSAYILGVKALIIFKIVGGRRKQQNGALRQTLSGFAVLNPTYKQALSLYFKELNVFSV